MGDMDGTVVANRRLRGDYWMLELLLDGDVEPPQPGRFLMIRVGTGSDPLLRRPFGIHDFWVDGYRRVHLRVLYRVVGRGTALMTRFAPGETVDVIGPLGRGFDLETGERAPVILAGGIGGAPLVYLARAFAEAGKRPRVFAGGNGADDVLGGEEFRGFGLDFSEATVDGSVGFRGTVVECFLRWAGGNRALAVYACGPWPMLGALARECREHGWAMQATVDAVMACGMGLCVGCAVPSARPKEKRYLMVCQDGPVFRLEDLAWEDRT